MDALGLAPEQLHDTRYPSLLAKAVKFLETEPNWRLTVSKVLTGKPMAEPLRVIAEYADIRRDLGDRQDALKLANEKLEKLRLVADPEDPNVLEAMGELEEAQRSLASVYEEVRIYEK